MFTLSPLLGAALLLLVQKRKELEEPEVIDLLDSSDDERHPPAARAQPRPAAAPMPAQCAQQQPQHAQQPQAYPQQQPPAAVAAPGPQPLKIRLPVRRITLQQQAGTAAQAQQREQEARQRALDAVNASRQLAQAGGAAMPQQVQQQQQLGVASPTHRVTSPTTLERLASLQQQLQHQQQPSQHPQDLAAAYNQQLRQGGYIPQPLQQPLQQQVAQPSSLALQFAMGGYMQQLGGPVAASAAAPGVMYSTYPLAQQPMGMPSAPGTAPVQMVPTPMATTGPPAYLAAPAMPLAAPSLPAATVGMPLQGVPAMLAQQQLPPSAQQQQQLPPQQPQRAGAAAALQGRPGSTGPGGSDEALDAYLQLLDRQNQSGDFDVDSLLND